MTKKYSFLLILFAFNLSVFCQVPIANFSVTSDSICVNDSLQFTDLSSNNPTSWSWSVMPTVGVSFSSLTSQNSNAKFTAIGTFSVVLVVTNATGSDSDTLAITVLALPNVIASTNLAFNDSICLGDSTQFLATGAINYTWNTNKGLSDSTVFNPVFDSTATSTYTVVGSDVSGCVNSASITVTIIALPNLIVTSPVALCEGTSDTLNASGASSYSWSTSQFLNDSLIPNPICSPANSITYSVNALNAFGCGVNATVNVIVTAAAVANGTVASIPFGLPAVVNFVSASTNQDSIIWDFGDNSTTDSTTNTNHTYTSEGTYTVTLIAYNAAGCNDTATFNVTIQDKFTFVAPNFFTPNYDDINDVWRPITTGIQEFYCAIYDRWGLLIFEWNRCKGFWDGHTTSGINCEEGVYYFVARANGKDGTEFKEKGYLHLFR
jgi:gliding motility-associated-like protein